MAWTLFAVECAVAVFWAVKWARERNRLRDLEGRWLEACGDLAEVRGRLAAAEKDRAGLRETNKASADALVRSRTREERAEADAKAAREAAENLRTQLRRASDSADARTRGRAEVAALLRDALKWLEG